MALEYPLGWTRRESSEFVLVVGQDEGVISLDVPDLPWHLPGMIRIGLVKNGYLKDLRKKVGPLRMVEDRSRDVADADAWLVRTAWQSEGREWAESALLMVHDDRVYIVRGRGPGEDVQIPAAFEAVVRSVRWVGK